MRLFDYRYDERLMLAGPRVTYALAQNRSSLLGLVQCTRGSARHTFQSCFWGAVSLALALSGTFVQLAGLAAIARLLQYIATCLALVKLHREMELDPLRFQLPGKHAIPMLTVTLCVGLLLQSKADQIYLTAGALGIGAALFWLAGRLVAERHTRSSRSSWYD